MFIKENLSKKSQSFNIQLLNAPKQRYKISLIKPKPFNLDNYSNDQIKLKENQYLDFSIETNQYHQNSNILYSTQLSNDDILNHNHIFINNYSKNGNCIVKYNFNNNNKRITIIDILRYKCKN